MNPSATVLDQKELLGQLRDLDMRSTCGDTQSMTMSEILAKMKTAKAAKSLEGTGAANSRPDSPTRENLRTATPKTPNRQASPQSKSPMRHDHSIARFRIPEPKWDKSPHCGSELLRSLYRIPCFDPSGTSIRSLGRDEAKGVVIWQPPEPDRDIPPATIDQCTKSFQGVLSRHLEKVVSKVDLDYEQLPSRTERERNIKAHAGADLFDMQKTKDHLYASTGHGFSQSTGR